MQYSQNISTSASSLQGIWSTNKGICFDVVSFQDFPIWK